MVSTVNPRVISNSIAALLSSSAATPKSAFNASVFELFYGQAAITHDWARQLKNTTKSNIPLLPGDLLYRVNGTSNFIVVSDSFGDYLTNEDGELRFHSRNENTDESDLSFIYGRDQATLNALRSGSGGRLKMEDYPGLIFLGTNRWLNTTLFFHNFPPSQATTGLPVETGLTENSQARRFTAGDDRVNENIAHTLIVTLFDRNHNYWAERVVGASDEILFQEARKMNIAEKQRIDMYEYLPAILGSASVLIKPYNGYDNETDVRTSDVFAIVAERYGNSLIDDWTLRKQDNSIYPFSIPRLVPGPAMSLAGQLGGPQLPDMMYVLSDNYTAGRSDGVNNILRGLARNRADENDLFFGDSARNIFFPGTGFGLIDLFAIDIQRGRLSQLPPYVEYRKKHYNAHGFPRGENVIYKSPLCSATKKTPSPDPIACFQMINSNLEIATTLQFLYGKVDQIDAFVGFQAEDHYPGSQFGRTQAAIIAEEYQNKRDGDAFWFENDGVLTDAEYDLVHNVTLSQLLRRNFNLTSADIQDNVFFVPSEFVLE